MRKLMVAAAVTVIAAFAEGRDGVMHSIEWSANNLASGVNWYDGVIAGEGGVATFEKSNYGTITQNIPGWTLSGPFRFTGDDNCWEVTGASGNYALNAVTFAAADAHALAGLKELKVTFDVKPRKGRYELSDALGLTAETVGNVAFTVADAAGNDYANIISLMVEGEKLILSNPSAVRTMIIIR